MVSLISLRNWLVGLGIVIGLAACATPSGYQDAIDRFAEATQSSHASLIALDKNGTKRLFELHQRDALTLKNVDGTPMLKKVLLPDPEKYCGESAPGCVLRIMTISEARSDPEGNEAPGEILVRDSLLPNTIKLLNEIELYAAGLSSVANADNTEEVKAGVQKAMGGVCGLLGTASITAAGLPIGTACASFQSPIGDAAAFVWGEYEEQSKLEALRRATSAMDDLLYQAATVMDSEQHLATYSLVKEAHDSFLAAQQNWDAQKNDQSFNKYVEASVRLNESLMLTSTGEECTKKRRAAKTDGGPRFYCDTLYSSMAKAHAELTDALNAKKADLKTMFAAIQTFSEKAKQMKKIVDAFKAAKEDLEQQADAAPGS